MATGDGHSGELEALRQERDELQRRCIELEERLKRGESHRESPVYAERYLRSIIDTEPQCVKLLDADGTLLEMNPAGLRMIQAESLSQVRGQDICALVAPEYREAFRSLTAAVCRGEGGTLEFRAIGLKGRDVWLETHAVPFRDERNERNLLLAVTLDITARKKQEAQQFRLRNLESLGTIAGGIAHDFNNLLTSVFGNIELARTYLDPSGKAHELLEEAERASERAQRLTQRLLTFAKGGEPHREPVALETLLRETVDFVLSGSSVRTVFSVPGDLWTVEADPAQIEQVIQNLASNAREAMPSGGRLELRAANVEHGSDDALPLAPGNYVKISFSDNGPGISEATLERIFDPYFTTKPMGVDRGGGLGLSICHSIVSRHRGYISARSSPGEGTTFEVYLPAARKEHVREDPGRGAPPEGAHEASGDKAARILVLEDDETVIQISGEVLDHLGYVPVFGRTGEEVIAEYAAARERGEPYPLVVLDLTVRGGMGGTETLERLREIDPGVRAVVSSGYVDDDVMADYEAHGFVAAVPKPFRISTLQGVLERYCGSDGSGGLIRSEETSGRERDTQTG